jgi:nitrogen fixation protein NifU and related proteins
MYSETVLDHFAKPRNVGVIEDADGHARIKSSLHDDLIDLYIKVEDGRIADIKFRTFGCVAAIASSSMTTELAKGLTLKEAAQLDEEQVVEALNGLPENKVKCSVLAPEALRQALAEYEQKRSESTHEGVG